MKKILNYTLVIIFCFICLIIVGCSKKESPNDIKPIDINVLVKQNIILNANYTTQHEDNNFKFKDLCCENLKGFLNLQQNGVQIDSLDYICVEDYTSTNSFVKKYFKGSLEEDIKVNATTENDKFYSVKYDNGKWFRVDSGEQVSAESIVNVAYTELEEYKLNSSVLVYLVISFNESDFREYDLIGFERRFNIGVHLNKLGIEPISKESEIEIGWQYYPTNENLGMYDITRHFNFDYYNWVDVYVCKMQNEQVDYKSIKTLGVKLNESMNLIPIEEYNLPGNFAAMFEVSNANVMFLNSTKYKIFNFKLTKAVQECEINKQVFTPHLFSNEIDLSELGIKLDVNKGPYATHVVYSLITESNIKGVEFSSDITAEILGTNVIIKDEISKTKKYLCLEVVRKGNELFEDFVIDVVIEIFEHEVEGNNCLDCGVELKIECNHEVLDYGICSACGEFLGEVIPVEIGGILTTLNERIYYFKITNMQNRLYGVTLSYGDVNCKFYNAELEDITEDIITDGEMFNYGEFFIIVVEANNFTEFELLVSEIE